MKNFNICKIDSHKYIYGTVVNSQNKIFYVLTVSGAGKCDEPSVYKIKPTNINDA